MAKKKIKESSLNKMSKKQLEKWVESNKKRASEAEKKAKLLAEAKKLRNK